MEPPRKWSERILEFCAILAFSAFLLKLTVAYIMEIWPYLVAIAAIILAIMVIYRIWKHGRGMGKW